jgi:hypothetical protein
MIDLKDPRFQIRIEHDIKSENFETHRVLYVVRLATFVDVCQLWLNRANGFYYGLLNVFLDLLHIMTFCLQVAPDECETPLVSDAIVVLTFVLNKFRTVLVDCIVCQVHKKII